MKTDGEFYESVMKKSRKRASGRFYTVVMLMLAVCTVTAVLTLVPARVSDGVTDDIGTAFITQPLSPDGTEPVIDTGTTDSADGNGKTYNEPTKNTAAYYLMRERSFGCRFLVIFLPVFAVCAAVVVTAYFRRKKIIERGREK